MRVRRKTLQQKVTVTGNGLHTGEKVTVTLYPAEAEAGICFRVRSGGEWVTIPALVPFVVDTRRRVVLGKDGAAVQTVEHLLATFFGLGITDALVEVCGRELPIGDGSALCWVEAVGEAGTEELTEVAPVFSPAEPVTVQEGRGRIDLMPCDHFVAHTVFVTDHPLVGVQAATYDETRDDFVTEIAPARTFGFWEEVYTLWEQGLAMGGNWDNAIVVFPDRYSVPLRFPNELARHKLLDLLGDLMLLGVRLRAQISVHAGGHALHFRLCQSLWQRVRQEARA
ncbi:MAG: hypothetical protein IMHGJWDQ_001310 [Candidatus Fervidibacter sp.]